MKIVIEEGAFWPGGSTAGRVVVDSRERPVRGIVELCAADLIHHTKVYRPSVASQALAIGPDESEARFRLEIPFDALRRGDAPTELPVTDTGWEVLWSVGGVVRASAFVTLADGRAPQE